MAFARRGYSIVVSYRSVAIAMNDVNVFTSISGKIVKNVGFEHYRVYGT